MLPWLTPAMTDPDRSRVGSVNKPRATPGSNVGHGRKNPLEPGGSLRDDKAKHNQSSCENSRIDGDTDEPGRADYSVRQRQARTDTCFERAKQGIPNRLVQRVLVARKLVHNQSALERPDRTVPSSDRVELHSPNLTTPDEVIELAVKIPR